MVSLRRALTVAGLGVVVLVVLVVAGFALGVLGVPTVDDVENRFGAVNGTTTTVETNLTVANPNPVGVSLGDLEINYTVAMNDVRMATGEKHGLSIESGRSTVPLVTYMSNERIPAWWYTHVSNGERTAVFIDVAVRSGLLGGRTISLPQNRTIRTDIVGQFDDTTTRPVNAGHPVVSDPILYINQTAAAYGEDVTRERTPLDTSFTVYNPKAYPYAVTEIGYVIRMNGVQVGKGSTERGYAVPGRSTETLEATTVIRNERLDEWWVSHLERDQTTNLTIDFYLVVDPDATGVLGETVEPIRLDVDELDYETTIETDIFGTKASDGLEGNATGGGGDGGATGSDDGGAGDGSGDGSTGTPTEDGGGLLGDGTATETETSTESTTRTETQTATETDDNGGGLPV